MSIIRGVPIGMRGPRAHLAALPEPEPSRVVCRARTAKAPFFNPGRKTAPIA
jgi:hypothetical protein